MVTRDHIVSEIQRLARRLRCVGRHAAIMPRAARVFGAEVLVTAVDYARGFAACSPASLALTKRQLVLDSGVSLEESRLRAVEYLARAKSLPDYAEAVRAVGEKRRPVFKALDINSIR